jgi:hypothetical protein
MDATRYGLTPVPGGRLIWVPEIGCGEMHMKVTTWAIVGLVMAAAAFSVIRPAQGCPPAHTAAPTAHNPPPHAAPAATPTGHRSFIIAARMGWL